MDGDRSALLIIRAWVEPGSEEPLRAQLRMTGDVSMGIERTVTLARPDEVCAAVREWLAAVRGRGRTAGPVAPCHSGGGNGGDNDRTGPGVGGASIC